MSDENVGLEFGHLHRSSLYTDSGVSDAVLKQIQNLDDVHKYGLKEVVQIDQSRHLTKDGKFDAYRKTGKEVDALLRPIENVSLAYGKRIHEAREQMAPKPHDRNDLAWQMEKQEVRAHLRALDPALRDQFILAGIERGDGLVMEAVKYSPVANEFGAQELIDKITARQIAVQFPEQAEQLRDMERAQAEVRSALASVRVNLARQGLNAGGDTLTVADAA